MSLLPISHLKRLETARGILEYLKLVVLLLQWLCLTNIKRERGVFLNYCQSVKVDGRENKLTPEVGFSGGGGKGSFCRRGEKV